MKLTKTPEYQSLTELPNRISALKNSLQKARKQYSNAQDDLEAAETELKEIFRNGDSEEIRKVKERKARAQSRIERLQSEIESGNDDLDSARGQLDENTSTYRKKLIAEAEKVLKEFNPVVRKMDELNGQLRELNNNACFGRIGNKHRTAPVVPHLNLSEQTKILNRKLQSWKADIASK